MIARIRDPFILPHGGKYYLYASGLSACDPPCDLTMFVYESTDLKNWSAPKEVFRLENAAWAEKELWAPEVYLYRGRFHAFFSLLGKNGKRGTYVAASDTPNGRFTLLSAYPVTPRDMSCIDGTLYMENDVPYMVFSHDWPDCYHAQDDYYDGELWAVRLTADVTACADAPFRLFSSKSVPLSGSAPYHCYFTQWKKNITRFGSDGPFITRLADGRLLLTWSPIPSGTYVVLGAVSESGKIAGPWTHLPKPLFDENAGHAMFFCDTAGKRMICMHTEQYPHEQLLLFETEEKDGIPEIIKERL